MDNKAFWEQMQERGIKPAVIAAGWLPNEQGVSIPYYNPLTGQCIGRRWWAYGKNRTWGYDGINYDAALYCLPYTEWSSQMYIVEGETSLMAMYSADMLNSVAIWGISATKGVGKVLQARGVHYIILICDNDEAGKRGAARLREELIGSGVHFEAKSIDKYVGHKGDVGDLWKASQNKKWFELRVKHAPSVTLPVPKKKKEFENYYTDIDEAQVAKVIEECYRQTETREPKIFNGNMLIRSPFREDKNPSFSVDVNRGLAYDFGIAKGWSSKQLAEELGLEDV